MAYLRKCFSYRSSILLCTALFPTLALADSSGFRLVGILQGLINLLNSGIARSVFILAIVGIGYSWLYLGQLPKARALGAIVGIGIVFSAGYIAQQLGVSA